MKSETVDPPKRKRGRPTSGVSRKEQVRRAVQKHRRSAKFGEAALLQVELPVYLLLEIKEIARRNGLTLRETVTQMLETAWQGDYVSRTPAEAERGIRQKAAAELIANWRKEYQASFSKKE